jgi:hypothetical protein
MRTLSLLAISTLAALSGCADSDAELFELDDEAATEGKADGLTGITRLERATATEVTAAFKAKRSTELAACFAAYQQRIDATATRLSKNVASQFITVAIQTTDGACDDWSTLSDLVEGVLDTNGLTDATPTQLISKITGWVKPQLTDATTDGYVDAEKAPLLFYSDLMAVREANAREREVNPTGISLTAIRTAWDDVRDETTLDRAYLNPVKFPAGALDGTQAFKYLRAAFPLKTLTLQSTGYAAISDFAAADEGPEGDPAFKPIATALKKSSITKRFYFARQGDWSSNVLIVVDNKGQAWGMQMGYSE